MCVCARVCARTGPIAIHRALQKNINSRESKLQNKTQFNKPVVLELCVLNPLGINKKDGEKPWLVGTAWRLGLTLLLRPPGDPAVTKG